MSEHPVPRRLAVLVCHFVTVLLTLVLVAGSLLGTTSSASATTGSGYDTPVHVYDAVAHSAQAHPREVTPVASHEVAEGAQATVATAVGPAEAADIAETGGLRIAGNSTGGKYFWETQEGAQGFANSSVMGGDAAVIEVRVSSAVANDASYMWPNLDGFGAARFYEGTQWTNFQNAIEGIFNVG